MAAVEVKGTNEMVRQAEAGLKLFKEEAELQTDLAAAAAYKAETEAQIEALEAEVATLTGKDNKKERAAKSKQVSEIKLNPQYIDACKVAKGLEPKNGFFVIKVDEPKAPEPVEIAAAPTPVESPDAKKEPKKEEKKPKKQESAGISPAERKELEDLKQKIIDRKNQLKADGLSGGQQNKDPQVVEWVTRMNELKEKAEPGSTQKDNKKDDKKKSNKPLSQEEQKDMEKLKGEVEVYKHKLKTEFGYSAKDMKADPDLQEMEAKLAAMQKRG